MTVLNSHNFFFTYMQHVYRNELVCGSQKQTKEWSDSIAIARNIKWPKGLFQEPFRGKAIHQVNENSHTNELKLSW